MPVLCVCRNAYTNLHVCFMNVVRVLGMCMQVQHFASRALTLHRLQHQWSVCDMTHIKKLEQEFVMSHGQYKQYDERHNLQ